MKRRGFFWVVVRPILFWLLVSACAAFGLQWLGGCAAASEWLAAPAGAPQATPSGAPAATNGELLVSTGATFVGALNPFAGYAVAALGRIGLGAIATRREKK